MEKEDEVKAAFVQLSKVCCALHVSCYTFHFASWPQNSEELQAAEAQRTATSAAVEQLLATIDAQAAELAVCAQQYAAKAHELDSVRAQLADAEVTAVQASTKVNRRAIAPAVQSAARHALHCRVTEPHRRGTARLPRTICY